MMRTKRVFSLLLAMALIFSMLPLSIAAAEVNGPKEEVIYVNLNQDGSVREIYVVNIFDLDADGTVIDHGEYESLRNMTATDAIGYKDAVVTVDAKAGKLYYEGKLKSNVMPWKVEIHYYMDGKEYTAQQIAGMSGDLKITLSITKNEECAGNFFEGYALQTSLSLDTTKCKNIKANGATMANVGKNKQLTYTILPGKGANVEITASVTDFELSSIAINGVKLKLNIEINDDSIQEMIDKILGAVKEVDEGAGKLNEGAGQLYEGSAALKDAFGLLYGGVGELYNGSVSLSDGLQQIIANNKELLNGAETVYNALCNVASTMLNSKLEGTGLDNIKLTPKNYESVLNQLLKKLNVDTIYQAAYNKALKEVTKQVEANADALYMGYVEANANAIYATYINSQSQAIYEQVAANLILEELLKTNPQQMAELYLALAIEKGTHKEIVNQMTADQKNQILTAALASLTEDQKAQIREGAVASMTADQKKQIREGYIDQLMKSEEVTKQINDGLASAVDSSAASIIELKGQLDNYGLFYDGLVEYTTAVSEAAKGANTLKINMEKLYTNVGTMNTAVGELNTGVETLLNGTTELKNGTSQFMEEMGGSEAKISDLIDSIVSSFAGGDVELGSFVSSKNTNVEAVQFVIKTDAITVAPAEASTPKPEESLNFWQKLLRLFGLY